MRITSFDVTIPVFVTFNDGLLDRASTVWVNRKDNSIVLSEPQLTKEQEKLFLEKLESVMPSVIDIPAAPNDVLMSIVEQKASVNSHRQKAAEVIGAHITRNEEE